MKKTFQLQIEDKHPDRLLDAIKHEIRKYLKRERRRDLPEGVDFWDFDCKFGLSEDTAEVVHLANVITCIDTAAKEQASQFYVEILAKHGVRAKRPAGEAREQQERHALDGLDDDNND
jgi:predicted N-acyltransferase